MIERSGNVHSLRHPLPEDRMGGNHLLALSTLYFIQLIAIIEKLKALCNLSSLNNTLKFRLQFQHSMIQLAHKWGP